jgi:predicted protein tyrosine phosphatase
MRKARQNQHTRAMKNNRTSLLSSLSISSPSFSCKDTMNWVIPNKVAVGDKNASADAKWLIKHNIRAIISVRGELSQPPEYYKKWGIHVLHIPITDHPSTNISKYFSHTYHFISHHTQKYGVLVHCAAGISRSTTLVIAYLMRQYKMSAKDAVFWVKSKRPCCFPNDGFLKQLIFYERALKKYEKVK